MYLYTIFLKATMSLGFLFTPTFPLFEWGPQSNEILLNMGMKCWNSAFNAQGSRLIIIVQHVGEAKIYVAAVQALRQEGVKTGWTSVYHPKKKMVLFLVFFAGFWKVSSGFGPNSGFWRCVFLSLQKNSNA